MGRGRLWFTPSLCLSEASRAVLRRLRWLHHVVKEARDVKQPRPIDPVNDGTSWPTKETTPCTVCESSSVGSEAFHPLRDLEAQSDRCGTQGHNPLPFERSRRLTRGSGSDA